jgi:hypothetical protein
MVKINVKEKTQKRDKIHTFKSFLRTDEKQFAS